MPLIKKHCPVDLRQIPRKWDGLGDNKRFIFGDVHANFKNWLARLVGDGAISMSNETYNKLSNLYDKVPPSKADYELVDNILKGQEIVVNKEIQTTFLGDTILFDRGKNQIIGAKLFDGLLKKGLNAEIIMGDHDMFAVNYYLDGEGDQCIYGADIKRDIDSGLVTKKEVKSYIENILLKKGKLLSYLIDEQSKKLFFLGHGGINNDIVVLIAKELGIEDASIEKDFKTNETKIALINKINNVYQKEAGKAIEGNCSEFFKNMAKRCLDIPSNCRNKIQELEMLLSSGSKISDLFGIVDCLMWSYDDLGKATNLHGHGGLVGDMRNLDCDVGKSELCVAGNIPYFVSPKIIEEPVEAVVNSIESFKKWM